MNRLVVRAALDKSYPDVLTSEAMAALDALAHFDADRKALMTARSQRRLARARDKKKIAFLDPSNR